MFLKILAHPIFANLNFHMPLMVDLSHPLIMLTGENGCGHGQVMLSMFSQTFPSFPEGTVLLLDEPEMALSTSNQRRILKMLMELVDQKYFRIIAATHSPVLIGAKETYVIDLDRYINRNVIPTDLAVEGQSTIQ
jgi:hypothetical protein